MYALNLDKETGRILSATFEQYATIGMPLVAELPQGDITEYLYRDGQYIHEPLPKPEPALVEPTQFDIIQAQVDYTAMMTNTLLEV